MRHPLFIALLLTLLAGCTIHKIDVQQGNVITQDKVDQLKEGMTRDQVRFLLGSPMLADTFHKSRWDYLYYFRHGATAEVTQYRLVLLFNPAGELASIDKVGELPAEYTPPVTRP